MPLLDAANSTLVLVDYQARLMPAIHEGAAVLQTAHRLSRAAELLSVPIVVTRQYPHGLGDTVEPLSALAATVVDKTRFGGGVEVLATLPQDRPDVVIAGCEAHVCLLQTSIDLLDAGRRLAVVADACGSRAPASHSYAMRRLQAAGAQIVTMEMVAFEWVRDSRDPTFKAISALIK